MKCFVSCVTYEPKLRPTMQCHVGLYFLSNSFFMKAAMSFSMLYFSKAWWDDQSVLVTASWSLVLSRHSVGTRISQCTTERDPGLSRGKNQVLNFKEQKKICFWPQDRWNSGELLYECSTNRAWSAAASGPRWYKRGSLKIAQLDVRERNRVTNDISCR